MKISAVTKYFEDLQFACDVIFDEAIQNVVDMTYGLSDALDRLNSLDVGSLLEESMQQDALLMWNRLIGIGQKKCEQLNKKHFLEITLEILNKRLSVIYQRFPLIKHIDTMPCGESSVYNDMELLRLLLQSNVETLNIPFTKCKDVVETLLDKKFEFQNLYSDIEQSNIQIQMERKQQAPSTDADDNNQREIPIELQSEKAQRILGWLVEGGFLTESYIPTDKLKPKRKLAYLCYKMSKALNLGKNNRGSGTKDNCWYPFEKLFNTTGLGNNFNQLQREYNYKINGLYPDIDAFFD